MSKQVLNRPMFAKMRDGSVKPVQYAWGGLAVSGLNLASKALPYAGRGLSAIKNTLPSRAQTLSLGLNRTMVVSALSTSPCSLISRVSMK